MRQPVQELIERYQNNLYAIAFNICKNQADAEDVVQDTLIQYYTTSKDFEDEQHIRAWLIRIVINKAKNTTLAFWRRNRRSLEDYIETLTFENPESENLFEEVLKLPEKYRIVIHLFYYEDYSVREIADILKLSESNVKTRLSRGRSLLKTPPSPALRNQFQVSLQYCNLVQLLGFHNCPLHTTSLQSICRMVPY